MQSKLLIVVLFTCTAIFLSACGRGRDADNDNQQGYDSTYNGVAGGLQIGAGDVHSLTISVPMMMEPRVRRAGEMLSQSLAGQGLNIEFMYYTPDNTEAHYQRLLGMFAAGIGPDIVYWGFTPWVLYRFIENGFLADIYPLIDQSPTANRTDFFTGALEAFEFGGELLMFPLQFSFEYVGINANAPRSFINRFGDLDRVTPSVLMGLYDDLISQYPEWGEYAFIFGSDVYSFSISELSRGVDFVNRTVSFDNAPLLEDIARIFEDNHRFGTQFVFPATDEFMSELQERYVFYRVSGGNGMIEALFEFESPFFVNYAPVAEESGRLLQGGFTGANVSINSSADGALAWALVENLITYSAQSDMRFAPDVPIARRYFRDAVELGFQSALMFNEPRPLIGGQVAAVEQAISRLEGHSDMPTAYRMDFLIPFPVSPFFDFLTGESTLSEAPYAPSYDI